MAFGQPDDCLAQGCILKGLAVHVSGLRYNEAMEVTENVAVFRFIFFYGVLLLMCAIELWKPFRAQRLPRSSRWPSNVGVGLFNVVFLKLIFPVTAVGFAAYVESRGWGFFSLWSGPAIVEVILAVVILDMGIYWQHRIFHKVPMLWRLHRMHHADTDFDVTTGVRFHPLEILLSMMIKFWMILALGPSALAVFMFEVILNAIAMFNHSNFTLPKSVDSYLRLLVVTPDMHRIHHSTIVRETNSNYGFNIPWWDRIFGSYISEPERDPRTMPIGIDEFREESEAGFGSMLTQPFREPKLK